MGAGYLHSYGLLFICRFPGSLRQQMRMEDGQSNCRTVQYHHQSSHTTNVPMSVDSNVKPNAESRFAALAFGTEICWAFSFENTSSCFSPLPLLSPPLPVTPSLSILELSAFGLYADS